MIPRRIRQDFERSNGVLSSVSSYSTSTSFFALCIVVEVLSFVLYAIYIRGMLPPYNKRVILDESQERMKQRIDSLLASRSPIYSGQDPFESIFDTQKNPSYTRCIPSPYSVTSYCSIVANRGDIGSLDRSLRFRRERFAN